MVSVCIGSSAEPPMNEFMVVIRRDDISKTSPLTRRAGWLAERGRQDVRCGEKGRSPFIVCLAGAGWSVVCLAREAKSRSAATRLLRLFPTLDPGDNQERTSVVAAKKQQRKTGVDRKDTEMKPTAQSPHLTKMLEGTVAGIARKRLHELPRLLR